MIGRRKNKETALIDSTQDSGNDGRDKRGIQGISQGQK